MQEKGARRVSEELLQVHKVNVDWRGSDDGALLDEVDGAEHGGAGAGCRRGGEAEVEEISSLSIIIIISQVAEILSLSIIIIISEVAEILSLNSIIIISQVAEVLSHRGKVLSGGAGPGETGEAGEAREVWKDWR